VGKKKRAGQAQPPEIVVSIAPFPLEYDAYYVMADLSEMERARLKLAWEKMNEQLSKPKLLFIAPENIELRRVPSSILKNMAEQINAVLKERGDL